MYALESSLNGQPIVSLQTGLMVAVAGQPILDISNLEMVALTCLRPGERRPVLLMAGDIRQFASDCIIIDDEDQLTDPEDIVRFNADPANPYTPLKKPVIADTGRKLGRVTDYTLNLESNRVQKLYVRPPMQPPWSHQNLLIDRTQIIDITPERITVHDATVTDEDPLLAPKSLPEINP